VLRGRGPELTAEIGAPHLLQPQPHRSGGAEERRGRTVV
jgi:hypothetical protein